ncbi:site-specific integrase [Hyphomicrobium sp. CS1GBMeth3]|uniref:site-specific integrase n=1 Tax=Hyphomicrobium sp. CS1GBMeth3 TaxID=1892845 RepID=UPI0015594842|nr:site-specific integrase [Hyphomicrobium sp. CS1GBMeth3]
MQEINPGASDVYVSDDAISGFRLKVTPKGKRVLFFQYRDADGRQRKLTFPPTTSVREARRLANAAGVKCDAGIDPQADKDRLEKTPTLAQAFETFDREYIPTELRASTASEYRRMFRRYIPKRLQDKRLCQVERRDIVELMRSLRGRPMQANNVLRFLSTFFNWCIGDGGLLYEKAANPTKGVKRYPDRKRSFVFESEELFRFAQALDEAEKTEWPFAISAVRLLLMSGMRKQEVLRLTWAEVDLQNRRIRLKTSKTGKRDVPLGSGAIRILQDLHAKRSAFPSEYVFPSPRDRRKPIIGFQKIWHRIRIAAGLPNLRVHDLRHNFGGFGAAATRSAVHVKGLLGHTQIGTTDRYMTLAETPLTQAADSVTEAIAAQMAPSNVVRIGGR